MALVRALELNSLLNFRNDSATSLGYVSMFTSVSTYISAGSVCQLGHVNSAQHTSVSLSALILCVSLSYI